MLQLLQNNKQKGKKLSVKENINTIKSELDAQEEFIKNFIKGERFIKKYKYYFLTIIVAIIVYFLGDYIIDKIKENRLEKANVVYNQLIYDLNNTKLENELKNLDINLYTMFLLNKIKTDGDLNVLKELSNDKNLNYLLKNIIYLNTNEKSIFLNDYEKLINAYKLMQENKIKEANVILDTIKDNAELAQIIKNLKHYQGIK